MTETSGAERAAAVAPPVLAAPGPAARRPVRRRPVAPANTLPVLIGGLTIALVLVPLVTLLVSSVTVSPLGIPFSAGSRLDLGNYTAVLTDGDLVRPVLNTAGFVVGSLAVGLSISVALAFLLERTDLPLRGLLFALVVAPVAMPQVVAGVAWGLLLDPRIGLLNLLLRLLPGTGDRGPLDAYSLVGITMVQGFLLVPFSLLLVAPVVRSISGALEEAAAVAGAPPAARIRRIVLPLLAPGLLAAVIYQFVTAAQSFDIPAVLGQENGVRVVSTAIYSALHPTSGLPDYGRATAMSVLLLLISLAPMYWYYRMVARGEKYAVITGRAYRRRRIRLGRWRWPAFAAVAGYVGAVVVLPLFILAWMSVQPYYSTPSLSALGRVTFSSYRDVVTLPAFPTLLWNTALLAVVSATVVCVLAAVNSWVLLRRGGVFGRLGDVFAFVTHGIPGVVLGVSLLFLALLLVRGGLVDLYGSVTILVIGMVIVTLGLATRITSAGLGQIHRSLEESAAMAGAGWTARMRRIVLPLMAPSLANAWVLAFSYALSNLTLTVVLGSTDNRVVAVELFSRWNFGDVRAAATWGLLLTLVSLLVTLAARWLSGRQDVDIR